jgi:hypothetical protein
LKSSPGFTLGSIALRSIPQLPYWGLLLSCAFAVLAALRQASARQTEHIILNPIVGSLILPLKVTNGNPAMGGGEMMVWTKSRPGGFALGSFPFPLIFF